MRIRASEFDTTEITVRPVDPGEILWNGLEDTPRSVSVAYTRVQLAAPSRINVNILDMTKLVPSGQETICDAGSISFGVELCSSVNLRLLDADDIVVHGGSSARLLTYWLSLIKKLTDYQGGFDVRATSNTYAHVGLGSTASLSCAVVKAANLALGEPFDERELVRLQANNYVESDPSRQVLLTGQSTGASGWVASRGGLCVVTSQNELAYHSPLPSECSVIIGIPELTDILGTDEGKGIGCSDVEMGFLDTLRHYDRFNAAKMCYWTLMELIPAVASQNMRRFGDVVWDMVLTGSKGVPTILAHGTFKPIDCLLELRKTGAEACFVSSVGPSMVTLASDRYKDRVRAVYEEHGCQVLDLRFNNKGYDVQRVEL